MNRVLSILGCAVLVLAAGMTAFGAAAPAAPAPAAPPEAKPAPAAPAPAAPAPAAPAAAQPAQPITATVKTVEGTVETRAAVGQPWTPVKAGQTLAEGADVRTGFRARCVLEMPQSVVQVDPLTVIRIGELKRDGNTLRTRIYLKQGNTESAVDRGGANNDFAVQTPAATLSVRGTKGIKCGFFPDRGGEYGLITAGLLALYNDWLHNHTSLYPGEYSNDQALFAIWFLAMRFEPSILDQFAFDDVERWAAMRWHTSLPFPAGLGGTTGIGPLAGIQSGQQHSPTGNSSDGDTIIIIVNPPGDGTTPPTDTGPTGGVKNKHGGRKP